MLTKLTPRQREVVALLADGLREPAIAAQLWITPGTAKSHIRSALRRLGATNRAHAVALALRAGEIQ